MPLSHIGTYFGGNHYFITVVTRFHPFTNNRFRFATLIAGCPARIHIGVSMALKPLSTKESKMAKDCCSSIVQPNTFPPKTNGAVYKSLLPNFRFSMLR